MKSHIQKSLLAALLILSCTWAAPNYYINTPYDRVVWAAGKEATVQWDYTPGAYPISQVNIDLMDGPDANAKYVAPVAHGINPTQTSYTWTVPDDFVGNDKIFVRLTGVGPNADGSKDVVRYSHRFQIKGDGVAKADVEEVKIVRTTRVLRATTSSATSSSTEATSTSTQALPTLEAPAVPQKMSNSAACNDHLVQWSLWAVCLMITALYLL